MDTFANAEAVVPYAEGPPQLVPGSADMQRIAMLLLSEHAPNDARILVVGAGGGLEIKTFATARLGWQFEGVDPSREML